MSTRTSSKHRVGRQPGRTTTVGILGVVIALIAGVLLFVPAANAGSASSPNTANTTTADATADSSSATASAPATGSEAIAASPTTAAEAASPTTAAEAAPPTTAAEAASPTRAAKAAAPAADIGTADMTISKSSSVSDPQPGQTFTYSIPFTCSSTVTGCVDAVLKDSIPAGLEVITGVTNPVVTGATAYTVDWNGHGALQAGDHDLTVTFTDPVANTSGRIGLSAGTSGTIQVLVKFPDDLPKTADGTAVTNTASIAAANAATKTAETTVHVHIPTILGAGGTKSWTPGSALFGPGTASAITLTAKNTSNIPATSLTIVDPVGDTDPFNAVDFTGFGAVVFPAGADRIQINAVVDGSTIDGVPGTTPALPAGVVAGQVEGLEIVFSSSTGETIAAAGLAGSVVLNVAQRSVRRDGTATPPLATGASIANSAQVTVSTTDGDKAAAPANATYLITPLTTAVSAAKSFEPATIPAGGSSLAVVSGTNTSTGALSSLTLTEPGTSGSFFDANITFTGWDAASTTWPAGATSADVTVTTTTGPITTTISSSGTFPAIPAGTVVTGFTVVYHGVIAAGSVVSVGFDVAASATAGPAAGQGGGVAYDNTVKVTGTNAAGESAPAVATAVLTVSTPAISVTVAKTIAPKTVLPGNRTLVKLTASTPAATTTVRPTEIVINEPTDVTDSPFWNSHNATAIAPTTVPAGALLTILYTVNGTDWLTLDTVNGPQIYSKTIDPAIAPTITGLRFVFTDSDGFSPSTEVNANISFRGRDTLRSGGTTQSDGTAGTDYQNCVTAEASRGDLEAEAKAACATGTIVPATGTGVPVDKDYDGAGTVSSRSQDTVGALLRWSAYVPNLVTVRVSDPADPAAAIASTSFDAFNLTRIDAISPTAANPPANPATATVWGDPLIRWDSVAKVELRNGSTNTYDDITTAVCGVAGATAGPCDGAFPGYNLTAAQQASTVGVRITFKENPFRQDQIDATDDPIAPEVGSGVATSDLNTSGTSSALRPIHVKFQVRDTKRSDGTPALGGSTYNTPGEPGVVTNTVASLGTPATGPTISGSWFDTVNIVDQPLTVKVSKTATPATLTIPQTGAAAGSYPSTTFLIGGYNTSATRVDSLTLTDPTTGASPYLPASNPFESFTLTKIAVTPPAGAVAADTVVTVTYRAPGTGAISTTNYTLTAAAALAAGDLVNAVGVSVKFTGRLASCQLEAAGGTPPTCRATLALTAQLRSSTRSGGAAVVPATVGNTVKAALDDLVLANANRPPGDDPEDQAAATVVLAAGTLAVATTKTINPATSLISSAGPHSTTVTVSARNTGTAAPTSLVITDDAAAFWNNFDLVSLAVTGVPTGADQVAVDAKRADGTWVNGTAGPIAGAASPIPAAQVVGLRFTFSRVDGAGFSAVGAATVSLQTVLRTQKRDGSGGVGVGTIHNTEGSVLTTRDLSASGTAAADYTVTKGTAQVSVQKSSVGEANSGSTVPFRLTFQNSGTGYLTDPVVVDTLPADGSLIFEPTSTPSYTTSPGGTLSTSAGTDGVEWTYDPTAGTVVFTFPDGSIMQPGEIFTITLPLKIKAGLQESVQVLNTFGVTPAETLTACDRYGSSTRAAVLTGNTCSTTAVVRVLKSGGFISSKGVNGSGPDGSAVNVLDPGAECHPDSAGFYRYPCADGTVLGGTDTWRLKVENGGNIPSDRLRLIDVLPHSGDSGVVATGSRGSTFRPAFAGNVELTTNGLADGTTFEYFVTTDAVPCTDDIDLSPGAAVCAAGAWSPSSDLTTNGGSIDPADVTALKFAFSFDALPNDLLPPGAEINIDFDTVNLPSTTAGDDRLPATSSAAQDLAWNSFGVGGSFTETGGVPVVRKPAEPIKAGVQVLTGPLEITKKVTGGAAAYAPTSFEATVSCVSGSTVISLPDGGDPTRPGGVTLSSLTDYAATLVGIPVGARCSVVELGSDGSYGEATRTISPASVTITAPAAADGSTPAGQQVTITNDYPTTSVTVKKTVSSDATVGTFGPFGFVLECTFGGHAVVLAATDSAFTLQDGQSHTVDSLPLDAVCSVTESDSDAADAVSFSVDGGTPVAGPRAGGITADDSVVRVTNTFDSGTLAVLKTVDGSGAGTYGAGPFTVAVRCVYGTPAQVLYDGTISVSGGKVTGVPGTFPLGTTCQVAETVNGGANVITVDTPSVTLTEPDALVTVNVTNTFNTGTLRVNKIRTGDGAAAYGNGSYVVDVSCTYVVDGATVAVALPGSGVLTLDAANSYTAVLADTAGPFGIPQGASCTVTEPDLTGATSVSIDPSPVVIGQDQEAVVTVDNSFAVGSLVVVKNRTGDGKDIFGAGPFTVEVSCTFPSGTAPLTRTVDLSEANGYTATITGLLAGANCTVTETGDGGATSGPAAPIAVVVPAGAAVTATVTNSFDVADLVITKERVGEGAASFGAGPFEVAVSCVYQGADFPLGDQAVVVLSEANSYRGTVTGIPVGAICTVDETGAAGATSTTVNGVAGVTGEVVVNEGGATANIVNTFELGSIRITKVRVGEGAKKFGAGPFTVAVQCTVTTGSVVDLGTTRLVLAAPDYSATRNDLPVGAVCTVNEIATGGAQNTVVLPNDGTDTTTGVVTVAAERVADVVVTNRFDLGDIQIVKKRQGPGVDEFGAGPFTVELTCAGTADFGVKGSPDAVAVADFRTVNTYDLTAANGYRVTVKDIPAGWDCVLAETDRGLATKSEVSPARGVTVVANESVRFTVTNTFERGQLQIDKVVDRAEALVDDVVTYTVSVKNIGTLDARALTADDLLPAGATFISADGGGKLKGRKISWSIKSLAVGASASFTVKVSYARAGTYPNSFGVTTPEGPWSPPTVLHPCSTGVDSGRSCAVVTVTDITVEPTSTTKPPPPTGPTGPTGPTSPLPNTGVDVGGMLLTALLALVVGGFLLVGGRRRRRGRHS